MTDNKKTKIANHRADIPVKYRGIYDRAMSGKSRAAGVQSFCLECMGWSVKDSADCNTVECPLYPHNPYLRQPDTPEGELTERQSTKRPSCGD